MNKTFFPPFSSEKILKKRSEKSFQSKAAVPLSVQSNLSISPDLMQNGSVVDPHLQDLVYNNNCLKNPLKGLASFEKISSEISASSVLSNLDTLQYYKICTASDIPNPNFSKPPILFNSNFESGNLLKAYKYSESEFVLILRPDYANSKYSHWFYFSVIPQNYGEIGFFIVNIMKKDLALLQGMQIVVKKNGDWERAGKNIRLRENNEFLDYVEGKKGFALSFKYDFTELVPHYFAYSYPYTYKDLIKMTSMISQKCKNICKVTDLCDSISGLKCPLLSITNHVHVLEKNPEAQSEKKIIVFMARVHPCESPSSYIIKGLINFLLSDSEEANQLRNFFIFKIIPMLNPDGVKFGNTRCSLLGVDLNRRWIEPNRSLTPEIFHAKEMIKTLKETHEIMMICDIHSHAKKRNVFMYGCSANKMDKIGKKNNSLAKIIPSLLAKNNIHFSYKDSHFKMEKNKEATARIVMFKEFGIINSYTVESSFFGSEIQKVFEIKDFENIGHALAKTALGMISQFGPQSPLKPALEWIRKKKKKKTFLTPTPKIKNMKKKMLNSKNEFNLFSSARISEFDFGGKKMKVVEEKKLIRDRSTKIKNMIKEFYLGSRDFEENLRESRKNNEIGFKSVYADTEFR